MVQHWTQVDTKNGAKRGIKQLKIGCKTWCKNKYKSRRKKWL